MKTSSWVPWSQLTEVQDTVEEVEDDVPDKEEVATKCVSSVQAFQINCGIQYIDFERRTDGDR